VKKILIIFCLGLAFGLLVISPFLIKVRVDCRSQYGACPQQILGKIDQFNGKSLSAAKSGIGRILKGEYQISDFSLQFKLPNTLHAELLIKKADLAFGNSVAGPLVLVDKEGMAIAIAGSSALPLIIVTGDLPKIGQNIGAENLFAHDLAQGIFQMYQIRNFAIQNGSLLVELPGQIRVILPLDGDTDILLGSLRLIYSKIQADGNPLGYSQIDLRFKNPVLR
jgi:hypothetical protein